MSASEAARQMGVSKQQIYNIENSTQGAPTVATLERYARAIGARLKLTVLP